jgi:neopullulanase
LLAENDVIAYARRLGAETVLIAINTATRPRRIHVPVAELLDDGTRLDEVWAHETARVEAGMIRDLGLGPRSGRVFATPVRR